MRQLLFIALLITLCLSCKREKISGGETVEIYLLKTIQTVSGKCQIDPSLSVIQDIPTIRNQDILEYSQTSYEFKLSDVAFQKVKTFLDWTPFAVTVGKQVIYYGFFKPGISSSSCNHSITMDIAWSSEKKIVLRLGYPTPPTGITIDDQRNNAKLLATLRTQGKLRQ